MQILLWKKPNVVDFRILCVCVHKCGGEEKGEDGDGGGDNHYLWIVQLWAGLNFRITMNCYLIQTILKNWRLVFWKSLRIHFYEYPWEVRCSWCLISVSFLFISLNCLCKNLLEYTILWLREILKIRWINVCAS